jgi:solute carrier family 12 (sodium/potassium/chloride transporter), member 2
MRGARPSETAGLRIEDRRRYGTFEGVFVPTAVTILGVLMFLREGWVVGNAGLGGAILLILLAYLITGTTGLSLSSVTTNIRVGAGGAYSVISKSLGLEVAGSIGIPLYLAQTLVVALYIFAFREGWQTIFPTHPALLIDLSLLVLVVGIATVSAKFSFRVQYVVAALVVAALVSVAGAVFTGPFDEPIRLWGDFPGAPEAGFPGTGFWGVFAVFFPAATGIMVGANMSGELRDPRRSIPRGTMAAIGVALVVYLLLAVWFARIASPDELVSNYTVMVDRAAWPPAVLAGLLGSAFSSALAAQVGAPRILQALASHRILPGGTRLARTTPKGEPRAAMAVTAGIVLFALVLRELNAIAPLITMFFLITYAMVNVVVLVEQRLGLVSFRPLMPIPPAVALVGAVGCIVTMFVIAPVFSLVAVVIVLVVYGYLVRRELVAPYGDVRSGLFVAIAEWGVKKATRLRGPDDRAWKPNLLVPVEDVDELRGTFRLIHDIASPRGSLNIMGVAAGADVTEMERDLEVAGSQFRDEEVFATWSVVETHRYADGFLAGMGALRGTFFRPNIVFLTMPGDQDRAQELREVVERAPDHGLGIVLFADHPRAGLGRRRTINVWLRNPDWEAAHEVAEIDLALLLAYKLQQNWAGRIRLLTAVGSAEEKAEFTEELTSLVDLARIPRAEVYALSAEFDEAVRRAPQADISLFGLATDIDFGRAAEIRDAVRSACLFVRGSGEESAVA